MNQKNTAIKRILADVKELKRHPSSRYHAVPLEDNMFEWHFTIRGPDDTPFSEGIYHGRILLPAEYPFKPPNIVFLTKNGRFEVGTKICLSISAYHEETWQPAWGVRTMLEALISFLPSEGAGAIGALDWTAEERRKLAKESVSFCCPICGPISALLSEPSADEQPDAAMQEQVAQLQMSKPRMKSERINLRNFVHDASLGMDGNGSGFESVPANSCDVDDYDNTPTVDTNGDGIADSVAGVSMEEDESFDVQDMAGVALDQLDNNPDAEDNVNHALDLHDPLRPYDASPDSQYPDQHLRHRRRGSPAHVGAPPAPAPAPALAPVLQQEHVEDPALLEPALEPEDVPFVEEELPRFPQRPIWGRDEDREPWRRFMDKILDIFILLTFIAIMAVSLQILTRLGRL